MKLFAIALCTLLVCPVFAGQYVGVHVGTNNSVLTSENHNPKIGYKAGANYGYKFDNGFRAEVELAYHKNNFKTKYSLSEVDTIQAKGYRSFHHLSYMANVLYDITQIRVGDVTPYVGIGAGYCEHTEKNKIKFDSTTHQDKMKDNRFAYQAIVGVKYDINQAYAAAVQYHYFCGQAHVKDHSVGVSLIRNF